MAKSMIVGYKGKEVSLFDEDGKLIRKFKARADVVNAQINNPHDNPTVAITTKDGKFELYKSNGMLIRRN